MGFQGLGKRGSLKREPVRGALQVTDSSIEVKDDIFQEISVDCQVRQGIKASEFCDFGQHAFSRLR